MFFYLMTIKEGISSGVPYEHVPKKYINVSKLPPLEFENGLKRLGMVL